MIEPREAKLKQLLAYWEGKRAGRLMPARADIDPVEIPDLLPHIVLVDTAERLEDFRYRLFGTEVCRGFAHDRTGVRFGDLPRIENFDEVYAGYWRTYAEKRPQYYHGHIVSAARSHVLYSRLTMPLSSDDEHVEMLLGGLVFFSACAPSPV